MQGITCKELEKCWFGGWIPVARQLQPMEKSANYPWCQEQFLS
jgi:hypothetical protein